VASKRAVTVDLGAFELAVSTPNERPIYGIEIAPTGAISASLTLDSGIYLDPATNGLVP